ncbi:hypothetical protein FJZ18_03000 [Candidatus Pacearchaeota archaeon]|nr:hypothetical protein [Candidatus Pacearchaeota archaeon]
MNRQGFIAERIKGGLKLESKNLDGLMSAYNGLKYALEDDDAYQRRREAYFNQWPERSGHDERHWE